MTAHLFQAEIPKTSDVRVTVVGRSLFTQQITTTDGLLDWRQGDWSQLIHAPIAVPQPVRAALHDYLATYELVFGCFDFALTGDEDESAEWTFIECNPNGQWGWLPDADQIAEALADVLSGRTVSSHDRASTC